METFTESGWIEHLALEANPASGRLVLGLAEADDAACLYWGANRGESDEILACSSDAIIEGSHFIPEAPAWWLAQRIVYAGISDLYAVGAKPKFFLISIADKVIEKQHFIEFSKSLIEVQNAENIKLLGGNTARAEQRQIHIFAVGSMGGARVLKRSGAKAGDLIALTGPTGHYATARQTWDWPRMRLDSLAPWLEPLRESATACIDVSDGLAGDLGRLCRASKVGARLWSDSLKQVSAEGEGEIPLENVLNGGEDYVLCFTVEEKGLNSFTSRGLSPLVIGRIVEKGEEIRLFKDRQELGHPQTINAAAFDHFLEDKN